MNEGDDKLLRRYREASRDEPPPAVDTAILAASRRAVASRPWSRRLAGPLSIAAVLVLAVGVTLNMQREQPGVEVAAPESEYSMPPGAAPETAETAPPAPPSRLPEMPAARTLQKDAATAPPAVAAEAPRPEPRAFSAPPASDMAAAPPAPALAARGAAQSPQPGSPQPARPAMKESAVGELRAKRELADSAAPSGQANAVPALPDPAAELERIGRLRGEGRHEEADKALDAFLRKHPGYRIPDPVWDRVKPR